MSTRRFECEHESDVLSAVYTNRWPHQVSETLRDHVLDCRICSDVVAVASAFEAETDMARARARVPDSAVIWWRAQLRARQEAAKEAVRPITVAQAIGLAAGVGAIGAIFGATATWFQEALQWMAQTTRALFAALTLPTLPAGLGPVVANYALLLGALALVFLLASLAVYVAVRATERDA